MSSTNPKNIINPDEFDTPPLVFEQNDDYGWTRIARPIVQFDGGAIRNYIKQVEKSKQLVSVKIKIIFYI